MLPYSAMTISRAARQLVGTGLFYFRKAGQNKILVCAETKKTLYEKGKSFLFSPVISVGYLPEETKDKGFVLANVSALAERSMLNHSAPLHYAVGQGTIDAGLLEKELINPYEQKQIEIWKYPPVLFSVDRMVDPLSLDLSLMEEGDERIEGTLEEMLSTLWEGNLNGYRI